VCLCVREDISGTRLAIFTNFSAHVAYGRGSVILQQGDEIPRRRDSFGGLYALYSRTFLTHRKTAEPIEMPFGMMSGLGPTNSVLRGSDDLREGRGYFGEKRRGAL